MEGFHHLCENILEEIAAQKHEWGYHFSFSSAKAWRPDSRFLIMTIFPSSTDYSSSLKVKPEKRIISPTPWSQTGISDFFTPASDKIQTTPFIRSILYELARQDGKRASTAQERLAIAADYAENHCPVTSFVPFRVRKTKFIQDWMWEFAQERQWPRIFNLWLPEVLIVFGATRLPDSLDKLFNVRLGLPILKKSRRSVNEFQPDIKSRHYYYFSRFANKGKNLNVICLPHPTASQSNEKERGIPKDLEKDCGETGSPFRRFLEEVMRTDL